jgi:hypothetical protein
MILVGHEMRVDDQMNEGIRLLGYSRAQYDMHPPDFSRFTKP